MDETGGGPQHNKYCDFRGGSMIFIGEGLQVLGALFCPRGAVLEGAVMDEKASFRTRRRRCRREGRCICLEGRHRGRKGIRRDYRTKSQKGKSQMEKVKCKKSNDKKSNVIKLKS